MKNKIIGKAILPKNPNQKIGMSYKQWFKYIKDKKEK